MRRFVCLGLWLLAAGCREATEVIDPSAAAPDVRSADSLEHVILPGLDVLGLVSPVNAPGGTPAGRDGDCAERDAHCLSGRFAVCATRESVRFEYEACRTVSGTFDGAWTLHRKGFEAGADVSVEIDGVRLEGSVTFEPSGRCWTTRTEGALRIVVDGDAATVAGSFDYCLGWGLRAGNLDAALARASDPIVFRFDFEGEEGSLAAPGSTEARACTLRPRLRCAER